MTIKDIARLSGYGVATVSRVLNNHPDVSQETRRKVLAVVEQHGFQPNNNAKHLKQQGGSGIIILVKGTQNMLFADLVERVQTRLQENNREAVAYYLDEDADEVGYALRLCRERKPVGILFLGGDVDMFGAEFCGISVPCVLLTNTAADLGFENLSSLTTDDGEAAAQVIAFLAEQGHRRIGVLGGNWACSQISYRRLKGCERTFTRLGLPFDQNRQCEPCRYSMGEAYAATLRLLGRCPDLTAIFAMSDVMAMGTIRALRDLGKRVPEDISVMGFDDLEISQYLTPGLSTIHQEISQKGEKAVELLINNINEPNLTKQEQILPVQLVERGSVKCIGG